MTEEWRPVVGWGGFYEVSSLGSVRSLPRSLPRVNGRMLNLRGRILKPTPNRDGYLTVGLCRDDVKVTYKVHRLVLDAFVGLQPEGMEACHFDDVKSNNVLGNLRWGTKSENTFDRVRNGNHYSARKTHCDHGHPFDDANTYPRPGRKGRMCRTCRLAAKRRYNHRMSEKRAAA